MLGEIDRTPRASKAHRVRAVARGRSTDTRRLTPRAQELLNKLLQEGDAVRQLALQDAKELSTADGAAVFEALAVRVSHEEDLTAEDSLFERLFAWVEVRPELRSQLVALIGRLPETMVPLQTAVKLVVLATRLRLHREPQKQFFGIYPKDLRSCRRKTSPPDMPV